VALNVKLQIISLMKILGSGKLRQIFQASIHNIWQRGLGDIEDISKTKRFILIAKDSDSQD